MTRRNLRKVGSTCLLTLLLAALAQSAVPAWGQSPGGPTALPEKIYTKSSAFDLPILMKDHAQHMLREVLLFVKAPGASWVRQDTAPPTATKFSYRAKEDGEYWFTLVTVDNQGRATPPDVVSAPPGLRVVVDTKAPVIDVQSATAADGECLLRCAVQDANPNPASLRVTARGSAGELIVETLPGQSGVYRIRPEWMNSSVRISATDLAGNTATRDINVKELVAVVPPAPGTLPPSVAGTTSNLAPPTLVTPEPVAPLPVASSPVALPPVAPSPIIPVSAIEKSTTPAPPMPDPSHETAPARMPTLPIETPASASKAPAQRRIINTTHASIDYRIDQIGPSGVGKVELYVTHDEGKTWRRAAEDLDRTTPAEIDLPGEGLFGVRLAITNGNGFGGAPPTAGAIPQVWIEVDTTAPFVQLRPGEIGPHNGAFDIRWSASDPNLGPEPVSLYFRTRADGPWQPIARGVKNDGNYRWVFPHDAGSQFFFRVEVVDLAGNVARAKSPTAIVLDMTEPRASVVGVTGMTKGN
jgi:hypothetical protein